MCWQADKPTMLHQHCTCLLVMNLWWIMLIKFNTTVTNTFIFVMVALWNLSPRSKSEKVWCSINTSYYNQLNGKEPWHHEYIGTLSPWIHVHWNTITMDTLEHCYHGYIGTLSSWLHRNTVTMDTLKHCHHWYIGTLSFVMQKVEVLKIVLAVFGALWHNMGTEVWVFWMRLYIEVLCIWALLAH